MAQINPYLTFDGNCRDAMSFYAECLDGELNLQAVSESPVAAQLPAETQEQILHSAISRNGEILMMASDTIGPYNFIEGTNISISLNCSNEEEINSIFRKLSAGGKINDPLKKQFWGALFGVLVDKYGIRWMLNYENNQ